MSGLIKTLSARAHQMYDDVDKSSMGSYSKGEVKTMLNMLRQAPECVASPVNNDPIERSTIAVNFIYRGDVFWHTLVGGKRRPWIVLRPGVDFVTAVALSTGEHTPVCFPSKSRFWPDAFVTATLGVISATDAMQAVSRPYCNHAHLREIEQTLSQAFQLPRKRPVAS